MCKVLTADKNLSIKANVEYINIGTLELLRPETTQKRALTRLDDGTYDYAPPATTETDNDLTLLFLKLLKEKYIRIPALRGFTKEPRTPDPSLPDGTHVPSQFLRYEKDISLRRGKVYSSISRDVASVFPEYAKTASMEDGEGQIEVYFEGYPSTGVGEGVKKHFALSFELNSHPNCIFGIEEPEIHLHPSKQREVYEFLTQRSVNQQFFITTHSSVIASKTDSINLRLVSINADKVTTLEEVKEGLVSRVIEELGIRPSDFFDSDCVVFVEGPSDVAVWEFFATELQPKLRVCFLDSGGWTSMQYYANAKALASRKVNVIPFLIFDGDVAKQKHYEKVRTDLIGGHFQAHRIFTLKGNSIEDYLLVPKAILKAFPELNATEDNLTLFISNNSGKQNKKVVLGEMLRSYGYITYKETIHAKKIAQAMGREDIDRELSEILEAILKETAKR